MAALSAGTLGGNLEAEGASPWCCSFCSLDAVLMLQFIGGTILSKVQPQ